MTQTILLFGSTGMLGWYIKTYLSISYTVISITRKEYDILKDNNIKLMKLIHTYKPTIIINCTNCYKGSFEDKIRINSYFPVLLDKVAHKYNCKFIHFSTNGVFLGSLNPYSEDDIPNASDTYGISKIIGENIHGMVIRTSILGESDNNRICLIEWLKQNKYNKIQGFIKDYWNGVSCLKLAEIIKHIIENNMYWSGIRHIFSNEIVSKYDICKYINKIYHLHLLIDPNTQTYRNIILQSKYTSLVKEESLFSQLYKQYIFTKMYRKPKGNYINKTLCRFCDRDTEDILHLGDNFGLAGGFLNTLDELQDDKVYPLTLSLCSQCKYIQCKQLVSSDEIFKKHYYYYSSMIGSLVKHFNAFAESIHQRYPNKGLKIIEIGCNDGVLLHPLKRLGYHHLIGIDPARTLQNIDKSIETYNDYFNDEITNTLIQKHDLFDIFISCNSFAHIEDMKTILKNIKKILKPSGIALIEIHHSKYIFDDKHFDFIYHEHMGYYTCTSLYHICKLFDMYLTNVECIQMHGGSLRCTIHMQESEISPSVQEIMNSESHLFKPEYINAYQTQLYEWKESFQKQIIDLQCNYKVYGYGASGRANTLMNFCEIELDGIIDDAPSKISSYTPLFNVLIEKSDILYNDNAPKYVVILAWPYANGIIEKHKEYLKNGGTFIIPLPDIKFITA
jgi:dTDP-4-dehydrorhamnose reductase/SAM-dependent methyltransferase